MKLTADQIAQNWDELLTIIKTEFTGERKDKLLAMYADMEDRMCGTLDDVTVGTEIDLDRDMPGFEGTMDALEDMVDNHVGEPEFLGGR